MAVTDILDYNAGHSVLLSNNYPQLYLIFPGESLLGMIYSAHFCLVS